MSTVESVSSAIANVSGLIRDRGSLRNAPDMKENKLARQNAQIREQATRAVAKAGTGDAKGLEEVRKLAS